MKEPQNLEENVAKWDTGATRSLRVLVVEDHLESARSLAQLLGLIGHEVEVAFDGPSALARARDTSPDVVFLDLGLPGMSGWEVATQLIAEARGKRPFIIALTGHGEASAVLRSVEVGVDLHLVKPVDPQQLEALLKRFQRVIG